MRLEDATLALEPRSVGTAIDLAILFYRKHALKLLALSLLFGALPVAIGGWRATRGDGWIWAAFLFFFGSPFLGAAVVAGAGHHVFGEDFTLRNALRHFFGRIGSLVLILPPTRLILGGLGAMCWGLLFVPLAARYGFLSEVLVLERLRGFRIGKRLEEILRHNHAEACGRYFAIALFALLVSTVIFVFLDLGSQFLFGAPIFIAKVSWAVAYDDVTNLFSYDPLLLIALASTWWLVYPLARIAWFFCYLDARVRKEGWDVEIAFRVEARRLA
ncbi:MAG: hypothetical protein ACRD3V_03195 [Vicinamibacteria bacterium]